MSGERRPRSGRVDGLVLAVLILGFGGLSQVSRQFAVLSAIEQKLWVLSVLLVMWLAWRRSVSLSDLVRDVGLAWVVFLAVCATSALWSLDPLLTVSETIALVGTVAIGAGIAELLEFDSIVRLALSAAWMISSISLVLYWAGVSWASESDGSIIGLLTHRNSVGAVAAFGVLLVATTLGSRSRSASLLLLLPVLTATIVSESRTAQVALVATLLAVGSYRAFRRDRSLGLSAACAGGAVVLLLYRASGGLGWASERLGKDVTLTGRTEIWDLVVAEIHRRPVTGLGFGVAWSGSSPLLVAAGEQFSSIRSSHNLVLEVVVALGWIGGILLGLIVLTYVRRLVRFTYQHPQRAVVAGASLMYILVRGLGESGFPTKNSSFTILLVAFFAAGQSGPVRMQDPALPERLVVEESRLA